MINIIDGNYELSRAVHKGGSSAQLSTSRGEFTSGIYLFLRGMTYHRKFCKNSIVVFDGGHSKRRLKISEAYKANRREKAKEEPETFQDVYVKECYKFSKEHLPGILKDAGIPTIKITGEEADDIIYILAKKHCKDQDVFVTSMDRDYNQCLGLPNVKLYKSKNKEIYTRKDFIEENQLDPIYYSLISSYCGDEKDGVYGVKGLGPKGMMKILREYQGKPHIDDFIEWWNSEGKELKYPRISQKIKDVMSENSRMARTNFLLKDLNNAPINEKLVLAAEEMANRNANKNLQRFIDKLNWLEFSDPSKFVKEFF